MPRLDGDDYPDTLSRMNANEAPTLPPPDEASSSSNAYPASAVVPKLPLTNRKKDMVRALACVMWADGNASSVERRIIEQVIDELRPMPKERAELAGWLDADCSTLDDVKIELLDQDEKEILYSHAVVLSLADDVQLPSEKVVLDKLIERLALAPEVIERIRYDAHEDGAVSLPGSALAEE